MSLAIIIDMCLGFYIIFFCNTRPSFPISSFIKQHFPKAVAGLYGTFWYSQSVTVYDLNSHNWLAKWSQKLTHGYVYRSAQVESNLVILTCELYNEEMDNAIPLSHFATCDKVLTNHSIIQFVEANKFPLTYEKTKNGEIF